MAEERWLIGQIGLIALVGLFATVGLIALVGLITLVGLIELIGLIALVELIALVGRIVGRFPKCQLSAVCRPSLPGSGAAPVAHGRGAERDWRTAKLDTQGAQCNYL